ncbi:hypothetical protein PoB_007465800 [Plakobranchus ocellatus]|uniref:Uncharacterized protein n=1 Tax=Plakobranchus ocellatus TaxID=259542 RepID=A0AAV4DV52_9GAST|nr:hypothetical protein PoB_007465800 [Plakobranchus ocellatus]
MSVPCRENKLTGNGTVTVAPDVSSLQGEQTDWSWNTCPNQRDVRLSGPPSGQGASGGDRTRDTRVAVDLRADSLATEPPMDQMLMQASIRGQGSIASTSSAILKHNLDRAS